jgi:signal peptidase II
MIYFLVILLGLVLDQASKWLVAGSLPLGASFELVPVVLNIHYVRNTGAAWSMFSNSTLGLAIFSLLMLVVLGIWFWKTPADKRWQRLALCLMISGAVGNMIDRFRLGYVVDFLELPHWPVFNVADMLLCCGVALLAVALLWEERNLRAAEKAEKSARN